MAATDGDSSEAWDDRPIGLIGAADNVLRLLRMFQERAHIRGSEVSRDMGISRSTASRLLATLQYHGFVEQDVLSRGYRAGPALVDIGLAALRGIDSEFAAAARDALITLKAETNETAHLAILRDITVAYIDGVESDQMVRTGSRVGWTLPAHATAAGKAILAAMPDHEVRALYTGTDSPLTKGQLDALMRDIEQTRSRGYGVNVGDTEPGLGAVGVALLTRRQPRMALIVTAPLSRVDDAWLVTVGAAAGRIAAQVSR